MIKWRPSGIRGRIAGALLVIAIGAASLDYLLDRGAIIRVFDKLDREEAIKNAVRCRSTLRREAHHLEMLVLDWAAWDDTYAFMATRDEGYIDSNLSDQMFFDSAICVVALYDTEGELFYSKAMSSASAEGATSQPLLRRLRPKNHLASHPPEGASGLLMSPWGLLLVAVHPVLTSENEGPVRGLVAMARLITPALVSDLEEQTQASFAFEPLLADSPEAMEYLVSLREAGGILVEELEGDAFRVHAELADMYGNPVATMQVRSPKLASPIGRATARWSYFSTLSLTVFGVVAAWVLFGKLLVQPIRNLAAQVQTIRDTGKLDLRVDAARSDEIGLLARSFNGLLARLQEDQWVRSEAERALAQKEEWQRTILEATQEGILTVNQQGKILDENPSACFLFGCPQEELRLIPFEQLWEKGDEEAPGFAQRMLQVSGEGAEGFRGEVLARRRDGTTFHAYVAAKDFIQEGERFWVVGIADITEVKELNSQLLRSEHLARIGQMGASIAHEIRNPITGIGAAVQMLDTVELPPENRAEIVREIKSQVQRAERTVQSLLSFARPWKPSPSPCCLRAVAESAWADTRIEGGGNRITFSVERAGDTVFATDESLLRQVLWNLLRNAVDAIEDSGRITVEIEQTGSWASLAIADTGMGMAADALAEAFTPFYTTKTRGTGLGLPLCRQIVESLGGVLSIESEVGKGTRATVRLKALQ